MEDIRGKIKGDRSFLEKIGKIIPGYSGYKEKLMRQEADKLLRDYLVQQIDIQSGYIKDIIDELTRGMKIEHLSLVDRPLKKLEKLRDRIKFAKYGYSGWFEPLKVDAGIIDKMYEFDEALINWLELLSTKINDVKANLSEDVALKAGLDELYKLIDNADVQYNERENFLLKK